MLPGTKIVGDGLSVQLYDPMHRTSLIATTSSSAAGTVSVEMGPADKPSVISRLGAARLAAMGAKPIPRPRDEEDGVVWWLLILDYGVMTV